MHFSRFCRRWIPAVRARTHPQRAVTDIHHVVLHAAVEDQRFFFLRDRQIIFRPFNLLRIQRGKELIRQGPVQRNTVFAARVDCHSIHPVVQFILNALQLRCDSAGILLQLLPGTYEKIIKLQAVYVRIVAHAQRVAGKRAVHHQIFNVLIDTIPVGCLNGLDLLQKLIVVI